MRYLHDESTGEIRDDEDGQHVATMSEPSVPEQGRALVAAYNLATQAPAQAAAPAGPVNSGVSLDPNKTMFLVTRAYCADEYASSPQYLAMALTGEDLMRFQSIVDVCQSMKLSSVRQGFSAVYWGPDGFEDEVRLQDSQVQINAYGSVMATDYGKYSRVDFEGQSTPIGQLVSQFTACQNGDVVVDVPLLEQGDGCVSQAISDLVAQLGAEREAVASDPSADAQCLDAAIASAKAILAELFGDDDDDDGDDQAPSAAAESPAG